MRRTNLFTRAEIAALQKYRGYRPFLAATWALAEVRTAIIKDKPEREGGPQKSQLTTMPQLSIFGNFEKCMEDFCAHCGATMEVLNQPVPFPYFHILKLLLLVALLILSYALIELLLANVFLSLTCYTVACFIMIGLEQIAIGMSDPFGNDEVDFDLDNFLQSAYDNAVAKLCDSRQPQGEYISSDMDNPLERGGVELRSWENVGVGLFDERPTPRGGDPKRSLELAAPASTAPQQRIPITLPPARGGSRSARTGPSSRTSPQSRYRA